MTDRLVVVYERVSSDKQDIERQGVQRKRAAEARPGTEPYVIQDDGVSAFKIPIFDRLGGAELCQLVEAGRVEAIYCDEVSRLSRGDDLEWVTFRTMCELNATRIVIDGQELRSDFGGRVEGYLKAALARQESLDKSHRVKGGKAVNARRGRPNGGKRRFGFEQGKDQAGVLVPIPAEVAVVERIFREVANGDSQKKVAERLNADGYRTAYGHRWHQAQISQIIRDAVWGGKIRNSQGEFDGGHGEVIPRELRENVQAMLAPSGKPGRGRPSAHFLLGNGLLHCGRCGAAMRVCRDLKGYGWYETYRCYGRDSGSTGCDMPGVRREHVDPAFFDYFEQMVLDVEGTVAHVARSRDRQLGDVQTRAEHARAVAAKAERQLERVDADYRDGNLDVTEWRELSAPSKRDLEGANLALADLAAEEQAVREQDVTLDATWETWEAITQMRAEVAGEINGAGGDLRAAQAAIRRVFEHVLLHAHDGKAFLLPVLRADALADPTGYELVEPGKRVPLQIQRFGKTGSTP